MSFISKIGSLASRAYGWAASVAALDPYFEYTTLLLPGNGTNGAQNNTFLDGSTNNFTITRNGNTTQGTFSPFSQTGWGNYFDGTGDYLTLPNNAALAVGSGQFCIEFWIYPTSSWPTDSAIFVSAGTGGLYVGVVGGSFVLRAYAVSNLLTYGTLPTLNTWTHIAICRNSSNVTSMYFNGSRVATGTVTQNFAQFTSYIGNDSSTVYIVQSYLSNLRLIKGSAVYDPTQTTITVPTAPLTAITDTSILTCQSNRFIDNSTNNFTITRNGDTRVVAFSPFNPTSSWSATTNGGSGYFDGNGDYLQMPSNAAFQFGTGDFCLEAWIYPTDSGTQRSIWGQRGGSSGDNAWFLGYNPTNASSFGYIYFHTNNTAIFGTSVSVAANSWTHVVFTCVSGRYRIFQNGVLAGTTTGSYNFSETTGPRLAAEVQTGGVANFLGYIASGRITKGGIPSAYSTSSTTVGTQIFTPPTTPITSSDSLTAGSLSVLLNFTNAGIYDATSKNDLETVGNAQISSTITPKWGSTSIKFNGSGDSLPLPASSLLAVGSGDFTIEMWVNGANSSTPIGGAVPRLFTLGTIQSAGNIEAYNAGLVYVDISATTPISFSPSILFNSTWNHFAITRSGTSLRAFVNGTQVGSTATNSTNINLAATTSSFIGSATASTGNLTGYIQDFRITKGYARYTANFTAPTAAFPTL